MRHTAHSRPDSDNGYTLDTYQPCADWFEHNPYGIHGIAHVTRVLIWANLIARSLLENGSQLDIEVVRWSAVLHDVGRTCDGRETEHGQRSAEWILANTAILPALIPEQIDHITYCCIWHSRNDTSAPQMTGELQCLKDADGLDRVRIRDLNPRYLRTQIASSLCKEAQKLYDLTGHPDKPWVTVRRTSLYLNLWH